MLLMGVAGSLIIMYLVRTFISSAGSQDILTACSVSLWDASHLDGSDFRVLFNGTLPPTVWAHWSCLLSELRKLIWTFIYVTVPQANYFTHICSFFQIIFSLDKIRLFPPTVSHVIWAWIFFFLSWLLEYWRLGMNQVEWTQLPPYSRDVIQPN